jgi:transcription elongation GreA/GreB family factor
MSGPTKQALKAELLAQLRADLETLERAHRAAREGATHEEAKPENDKDTRALEQSYIARGEALRLEEQRAALADVRAMTAEAFDAATPVRVGALVAIEEGGHEALYWIAQHGGGTRLAGGAVLVVTPKSPLGRALLGGRAGDEREIAVDRKPAVRVVRIASVS